MEDLELFYLRDLAFEHLPRDKKNLIESNLKLAPRTRASSEDAYSSAALLMLTFDSGLLKAVEVAAARLLFLVSSHPLQCEDADSERDVKELYDERRDLIVDAAFDLAKIAEISLPAWLIKERKPDTQSLQKEVDSLRAEVERLEAENAELKAELECLQVGSKDGAMLLSHESENLRLVEWAISEFYHPDKFDINDPKTYPKQSYMIAEIVRVHGVTEVTAKAIERVATPFRRGRAKK